MGIYKILKNNDIKYIKDKNMVEAQSFLRNSGISTDPRNYIKGSKIIKDYKSNISNRIHIPINIAFKILQKAKKNEAKEFYNKIKKYEDKFEVNEKVEEIKKENKTLNKINKLDGENKFIYNGYEIKYIKTNAGNIYFKGIDVANILEYKNPKREIRNKIKENQKLRFKDWVGQYSSHPKNEDGKTIFINEAGLYTLIIKSNNKKAVEFQEWITNDVLPSLRKNGSYVINPEITDYSSFKIEDLSYFYDYKVFYIFYVGFINNKHVFKYGITSNINARYKQHKNDFEEYNNKIYPIYVAKCENNREIESAFGDEMIDAGLKLDGREFKSFKGKKTELTTISNIYNIEFLIEKANFLIKNIKSRAMLERDVEEKDKEINNLEEKYKNLKDNDKKIISNLEEKYKDLKENNKKFINNLEERIKELKEKDEDNKDKIRELKNIIKNLKSNKLNFVNN
jgi:prophage antirepressor-like protein